MLRPNIPLSCATQSIEIPEGHTPYIPPHPQRGTPYHRYVLLLLPQPSPTEPISIPALSDADRLRFNVREFTAQHGLDGNTGGGAHMWRQVWDEGVSQIYATVLGMSPFPVVGPPILHSFASRTRRTQVYVTAQTRPICGHPWNQAVHQVGFQCSELGNWHRQNIFLINASNKPGTTIPYQLMPRSWRRTIRQSKGSQWHNSLSRSASWRSDGIRPCVFRSTSPPSPCRH